MSTAERHAPTASEGPSPSRRPSRAPGPLPDLSPARALLRAAAQHPQRLSLIDAETGISWTVSQVAQLVRRTAAFLSSQGVTAADRLVIAAENSPWHFLLHLGASWLHAVTVPISPRLPPQRLYKLCDQLSPALTITDEDDAGLPHAISLTHFAQEVEATNPIAGDPPACHSEVAAIILTSGSTGEPRRIELSHAHLWWASQNFRDGFEYSPGHHVVGVCAPLTHVGGFNGTTLDTLSHGGTLVVIRRFDPEKVLRAIERYRINMMFLVPVMCHGLLAAQKRCHADLSSLVKPLIGGDALSPALALQLRSLGLSPIHVWGMTETGGAGALLSADITNADGAIGQPFPYVTMRLAGEETDSASIIATGQRAAGEHEAREILVSGPNVVGEDEWLRTGDLGYRDDHGWIHMVGRASRMINTGGEMVAPSPIEEALSEIPGIAQAVVVGVADDTWGQIVAALAQWNGSGAPPSVAKIQRALAHKLAPWEQIRRVHWVDTIPVNPNGKADIARIKEFFAS
ncbi:class I adenylate-forming enzyme family protein [Schaalia sp. ZJ1691]|uniref:class I adenylate-forming enzyme family protein n=1 Tax=Schaalia sp. ZJ1691 TaxID=2709404 RepID=UPI001F14C699|nr:class I adenylate-forming enzyme family protein [Schaalia sp. ZJ1691]